MTFPRPDASNPIQADPNRVRDCLARVITTKYSLEFQPQASVVGDRALVSNLCLHTGCRVNSSDRSVEEKL